jgi:hypothetical protein
MRALSDVRDVEGFRDDAAKERFNSIDKALRDIQRGVQLVRDKQVRYAALFLSNSLA